MLKNLFLSLMILGIISGTALAKGEFNPKVLMKTTMGDILLELNLEKAPVSAENFFSYVDERFYDGTIFHRVIKGFMIQGGGHTAGLKEKEAKSPIQNEASNGLKNDRGTLAMARGNDPHSASCQFYINHVDNAGLNYTSSTTDGYGYCVFGKVIDGMDVVDAIANVMTKTVGDYKDVPRETITILSITRVE